MTGPSVVDRAMRAIGRAVGNRKTAGQGPAPDEANVRSGEVTKPPELKHLVLGGATRVISGEGPFFDSLIDGSIYSEANIELIRRLMPRGGVLYDIGANFGLISLGLADIASKTVAVEASDSTFRHLVFNTRNQASIIPLKALVGRSGVEKTLLTNTLEPGGSTSVGAGGKPRGHDYLVETQIVSTSLDSIVEIHGPPAFIKVDVEGAEMEVLGGAAETLRRFRPICLLEFNLHCLMNFGRLNPRDAIDEIFATFPYVYVLRGDQLRRTQDAYAFIVENVSQFGGMNDLVCAYESLD